jgi:hypothetical protein
MDITNIILRYIFVIKGYNIEWHIVVLQSLTEKFPEHIKDKYKNLAHATGGSCVVLGDGSNSWLQRSNNQDQSQINKFLDVLEASTKGNKNIAESRRKEYLLESRRGRTENFDWLKLLPGSGGDSSSSGSNNKSSSTENNDKKK